MNISVNYMFQIFFDILYVSMWFGVLNFTLTKRYSRKMTFFLQCLWFPLYFWGSRALPFLSEVRLVYSIVIFIAAALFLYKDHWTKVFFSSTMVYLTIITNEIIGAGLYYPEEALMGNSLEMSTPVFLKFMSISAATAAILYLLLYLFLNRQRYRLKAADWGMFVLFPFSQYVLMYGWFDSIRQAGNDSRAIFLVIAICACIVSDIGLFAAVMRIAQRTQLAAENSMLAAQVDSQEQHYRDLTSQYESIRRMRHDIANHLNAMESLMASGRNAEAKEYLQELNSTPVDSTLGMCEHPVVDAFLHNRISAARNSGVEIEAAIDLPANVPVSNVDLIRIFGNMLDNALEACSQSASPKISLSCSRARGCLIIRTMNPVNHSSNVKGRRIAGLERGIGQRVLSDIAEKYGGNLSFDEKDSIFKTELILNLGEIKNVVLSNS